MVFLPLPSELHCHFFSFTSQLFQPISISSTHNVNPERLGTVFLEDCVEANHQSQSFTQHILMAVQIDTNAIAGSHVTPKLSAFQLIKSEK